MDDFAEWKRYFDGFEGLTLLPVEPRVMTTETGDEIPYEFPVLIYTGKCSHYHEGGCDNYEDRPKPCRDFNCMGKPGLQGKIRLEK